MHCNLYNSSSVSRAFRDSEKDPRTQAMMYVTVIMSVWAIIQIGIYVYLLLISTSGTQIIDRL